MEPKDQIRSVLREAEAPMRISTLSHRTMLDPDTLESHLQEMNETKETYSGNWFLDIQDSPGQPAP